MAKPKKFKLIINVELDVEEKELREELGIDKEDDLKAALQEHLVENVELGLTAGDSEITSIDVK